jgi:hypothetical protein
MTCYNCEEPGHFVGIYSRSKVFFICAILGHYMTECSNWKKEVPVDAYMGCASSGLGFYLVEVLELDTTRWLNICNCGLVVIRRGDITLQEMEKALSDIFHREWSWQIRELTPNSFFV